MAYWGDLDPPTVSRQNSTRRTSGGDRGSAYYPPQQQERSRSNRVSTQSQAPTVSTQSPFVSPTASSFRGDGLAPRPPSFPYSTGEGYNKDFLDRRRRRASRDPEDFYTGNENTIPPPVVPDAPRPPPPLSYKQPHSNSGPPTSYSGPVRSRSARRADGPTDANQPASRDSYREGRVEGRAGRSGIGNGDLSTSSDRRRDRNTFGGDPNRPREYPEKGVVRRGTVGARHEKPEYHDPTTQSRSRKGSAAETEAQRRREWAPDRSPLQRLELTLDSITKEEKRARMEVAELLAREGKAGRGGERLNQNSVRFRNRPVTKTDVQSTSAQAEPESLPEAGPTRSSSKRQKDELQSSDNLERKKPAEKEIAPTRQLGTGFEYRPQQEATVQPREPEKSSVPQRGPSFRERAEAPALGALGAVAGAALSRSGSNKLKKEPPGDPWYSRRREAEATFQAVNPRRPSVENQRDPNAMTGGPLGSAPVSMSRKQLGDIRNYGTNRQTTPPVAADLESEEELVSPTLARGIRSKKIEQLTGHNLNDTDVPPQQQLYADRLDRSEELGTAREQPLGSSQLQTGNKFLNGVRNAILPGAAAAHLTQDGAARGPDGHHHFSDVAHLGLHRRSHYQPGDGLYAPHEQLEEWKKGGIGALTGALLDLEILQTETEKDKAWWETSHKGKRRPSRTKDPKIETYDGEQENSNGMILSNLSNPEDYLPFIPLSTHRTWSTLKDPVVPRARQSIGYRETSGDVKTHRWLNSWFVKKMDAKGVVQHQSAAEYLLPSISSPLSNSPKLSKHDKFHPFHVSPNEIGIKKLTPTMRLIRVSTTVPTQFNPPLYLKCGPLLRYCGLRHETPPVRPGHTQTRPLETWRGSVMIVTADSESSYKIPPTLRLFAQPLDLLPPPPDQVDGGADKLAPEYVDPIAGLSKIGRDGSTLYVRPVECLEEGKDYSKDESDTGLFGTRRTEPDTQAIGNDGTADPKVGSRNQKAHIDGERLGKYAEVAGFRLHAELGFTFWRFNIEIELRDQQQRIAYRINRGPATGFWVPARGQSMNMMFHTCNGFSLSVNPDQFSGPDPMWRDVLNTHQTQPFHVMIGGGDQIYNDSVMKHTKLFSHWLSIKNPLEKHNAPFTPQMQEELESFYLDRYSMWFSQGLFGLANSQIPMVNVFDDHDIIDGFGSYPDSFMDAPVFSGLGAVAFKYYLLFQHQSIINEGEETEPSWLLGVHPGPYIKELSRSLFMRLGTNVAFLGLDCRTERSQEVVLTDETYDKVFQRMNEEIVKGEVKHLIVLLGIPIAYPRLVWLENILTSRLMDPIKAMGKAPIFGNLISQIDGGVEVLDDLNDHWTAKNHKAERKELILELQDLAAEKSVRITFLGGDVHLAAVGQFFSNPKLGIPKNRDYRYMPNIISSAIVNTPPPNAMADILNKRNKVHHLDETTDENMIPIFTHDVNGANRNNKRLLPRRNWCSIREYNPSMTPPPTPPEERSPSPPPRGGLLRRLSSSRGPSYRPDVGPPVSRGLMRNFSLRGRQSMDSERPVIAPRRTLSLSRKDFIPGNLFRRGSKRRPDDGGINGYGASSDEEDESPYEPPQRTRLRGGAGDESYFPPVSTAPFTRTRIGRNAVVPGSEDYYSSADDSPEQYRHALHQQPPQAQPPAPGPLIRPFHRTPTDMSEKQRRKLGTEHEVNLEGGLDIRLNVEVSQRDPAGITVPYRFLVPALWYEDLEVGQEGQVGQQNGNRVGVGASPLRKRAEGGLMRLMSLGRGKGAGGERGPFGVGWKEKEREPERERDSRGYEDGEEEEEEE